MTRQTTRLPYINNAKAVMVTLVINVACVFFFNYPSGVTFDGVMLDSIYCAIITSILNMAIIYPALRKKRAMRDMPLEVPVSALMQKLPANPVLLAALYAACFTALTVAANWAVFRFFHIERMAFAPWLVYKLIYATLLSAKIVEYCIFRYVQPDWAGPETRRATPDETVKNPLPGISLLPAVYGSVTGNIATNIVNGTILGGVRVLDNQEVVIYPTRVEGIHIGGMIFGLLCGALITNAVLRAVKAAVLSGDPLVLQLASGDKKIPWFPKKRIPLTCFICAITMAFSVVALRSIWGLFDIRIMNFYQYVIFITVYAALVSKPISALLAWRCRQPDYIRYVLDHNPNSDDARKKTKAATDDASPEAPREPIANNELEATDGSNHGESAANRRYTGEKQGGDDGDGGGTVGA